MEKIPESSIQGILAHVDPCTFPSFGNVGPPMMATLSIHGLTIGVSVWLFSIPNVPNAPNASLVRRTCQRHHINTDTLLSTLVKYFYPSSSSSGESMVTSNQESKNKKKKSNKKKPNQDNKILAYGHHVGGKPLALVIMLMENI